MQRFIKALAAASSALLVLAACSPQLGSQQPTSSASGAGSPSATVTGTPAAPTPSNVSSTPPAAPGTQASNTQAPSTAAAKWTTFKTADGTMVFDVPAAWTVKDPAGELAEGGGAFAEVRNQAGKVMATLRTNMATGSTCTERYPYEVLDSVDIPALAQGGVVPQFVFETRGNAATPGMYHTPAAGYGITSGPAPSGPDACPIFQFFRWPPNAAMFSASYDPENNATPGDPSLPYLERARKYRDTAEYADIKQMITSLRPVAGGRY
ncbi:hypothetical protein ACFFGR_01870 [Arthrobacter liuii]|uniref:hypothetical protein n=1 Tax=Arthrobacter liuii TaxID=1476996 RepID=UPI00166D23B5|nr:hypothetical protein [Arthrobacter liuii]